LKGNYFFYAIIGFTVTAALGYLNKAMGKHIDSNINGEFFLRMNKLYNIVGYIGLLIGLIVTIGPVLTDQLDFVMYLLIFFAFFILIGLGLLAVLFYRNHYIRFDNSKIEVRSPFAKTRIMKWDEIKKASFNPGSGFLILKDQHGQKIKIHQHIVGLGRFVSYLESKTDWTTKK
jgi:hypothetical protein